MAYDFGGKKREAIEAGESALKWIWGTRYELNNTRSWGTFEIIHNGEPKTFARHCKADKIVKVVNKAKGEVSRFARELQNVEFFTHRKYGARDFANFADHFFDGLQADFCMKSELKQARAQADEALRRIQDILIRLKES